MGAGTGWFADGYWHPNYWHANYWAPTGTLAGDYWSNNYWATGYWHPNYWAKAGDIGDVLVTDDVNLFVTPYLTQVQAGPSVLASTGTVTLNAFATDANLNVDPPVTSAALTLAALNPGIGTSGYVLGDIELTFSPESTLTITYGLLPGTGDRPLQGFHPTTSTNEGLDVGVGTPTGLGLTAFPVLANNNVNVEPVPQSLSLTAYDSPAAGIGELIRVPLVARSLTTATHTIVATPVYTVVQNALAEIDLTVFRPVIVGREQLSLPPPTFAGDVTILNPDAVTYPSNYEICDRTGFRVRRGGLQEEWTGVMVRPESWERRNIQDFVRGVGDEMTGSPRPEQDDQFIGERYPQGVSADDL